MVPSFDALTPEAREAADKATREIDSWIDEKVDDLSSDLSAELKTAVTGLQTQVDEIEAELTQTREAIEGLLGQLDALKADLDTGDAAALNEAISKTRSTMETAQRELAAREARWKGVGSGIVNQVTGAIGKVLPFSL